MPLRTNTGRPLLVNPWANWCRPCVAELNELTRRKDEIRAKRIQIVALSVDGMREDASDPTAATRLVQQIDFPFVAGVATPQPLETFQFVHDGRINIPGDRA